MPQKRKIYFITILILGLLTTNAELRSMEDDRTSDICLTCKTESNKNGPLISLQCNTSYNQLNSSHKFHTFCALEQIWKQQCCPQCSKKDDRENLTKFEPENVFKTLPLTEQIKGNISHALTDMMLGLSIGLNVPNRITNRETIIPAIMGYISLKNHKVEVPNFTLHFKRFPYWDEQQNLHLIYKSKDFHEHSFLGLSYTLNIPGLEQNKRIIFNALFFTALRLFISHLEGNKDPQLSIMIKYFLQHIIINFGTNVLVGAKQKLLENHPHHKKIAKMITLIEKKERKKSNANKACSLSSQCFMVSTGVLAGIFASQMLPDIIDLAIKTFI